MDTISIRVDNLTKSYKLYDHPVDRLKESLHPLRKKYHKDFYALKNLSFEIKKGETVGIIGKNGSGKSTLLKIITGVLTPTSGTVHVNGKVSALLELGAGFNPELTGIENIYLNGMIMGYSKEEMNKKIDDILSFAEIGQFVYQPVKMYSSGMFARLAFAVAINVEPDILIVDEALAVGDLRFQIKCMEKFTTFREQGKTILFVTHDINSVKRFCTKTIWINEGVVQAQGETDIVTDMYLDFLKIGEVPKMQDLGTFKNNNDTDDKSQNEQLATLENKNNIEFDIARIKNITMFDALGNSKDIFQHNDQVFIEVEYEVREKVEKPVLGVAIRTLDHIYICGVNTLLDKIPIKWDIGVNKCRIRYDELNLIGGSYYIDVAIMEQNATVPIEYLTKAKIFTIRSNYIGEGLVILKHQWEVCDEV
ncbi:ABC transporter ATP-binding protein [Aneurinibacillus terranovensis]|uniref:ABC transporter ATP-binding protein n=1 Tax=Aneurinibacillus terranovensis TaxID=278991 RepID=UPI000408569A|nr:ABC transporter ATP-binding protein [Aneurinibacillus terranovensis]